MSKTYSVKEIYYTLQGEGFHSGRPAIFCRFSGCNLWSGREEDRKSAICTFCDTDFVGTDGENGGKYSGQELVDKLLSFWSSDNAPFVVFTGGEPALQLDVDLVQSLHEHSFEVAIETNGTVPLPEGVDWICMSPKPNTEIKVSSGHELKFVFPQSEITPEDFVYLDFEHFYIQPMESDTWEENIKQSIDYCKKNPKWKLSLQTHKYLNIP